VNAEAEEQFREFTERWHALLRTAYVLTGDHGQEPIKRAAPARF
jgi:hypothetical protein